MQPITYLAPALLLSSVTLANATPVKSVVPLTDNLTAGDGAANDYFRWWYQSARGERLPCAQLYTAHDALATRHWFWDTGQCRVDFVDQRICGRNQISFDRSRGMKGNAFGANCEARSAAAGEARWEH
jgi:hypothetical protein